MSNTTEPSVCRETELFDQNSKCFTDFFPPNITNCNLMLIIYRLILVDCYIKKVFTPTVASLIVVGTFLNLFSLFCFLKMNKRNSQNVYLSVLSLGDTINLHVNFTVPLLRTFDVIDEIFQNRLSLCRINGFFTEFFLIFPTWIVVLLTFERLICVLWPLYCHSLYTHKRAKLSIFFLALLVMCLCFYRFFDLKGIDQVSVFQVAACDDHEHHELREIRYFNLFVWAILPECATLTMNLIIIYKIKLASQKFEPFNSKARQTRYNQATKTVLLISILFLVFHTPTGISICLNLIYAEKKKTIALPIILVSRKITVILYEISLCCKFFIYNLTFRNFRVILQTSYSRFTRQANSAKIGRPVLRVDPVHNQHAKSFQFGPVKRNQIGEVKENDPLIRYPPKSSTSTSRTSREPPSSQQQIAVVMTKSNDMIKVSLLDTLSPSRRYTMDTRAPANARLLWRSKPQITL